MDASRLSVPFQSTPNTQSSGASRIQPPVPTVSAGSRSSAEPVIESVSPQQNISGGSPEQGPIQSSNGSESSQENAEDDIQPAKQEVSTKPANQAVEQQQIEVSPATPEVAIEQSIEHVVEKSPDVDKPKLSEAVKAVGVTHSGPGIPLDENAFQVKTLPMTFEQALAEEKSHPKLDDSKHWLAELVLYVWRKIDPKKGKQKGEKQENKVLRIFN